MTQPSDRTTSSDTWRDALLEARPEANAAPGDRIYPVQLYRCNSIGAQKKSLAEPAESTEVWRGKPYLEQTSIARLRRFGVEEHVTRLINLHRGVVSIIHARAPHRVSRVVTRFRMRPFRNELIREVFNQLTKQLDFSFFGDQRLDFFGLPRLKTFCLFCVPIRGFATAAFDLLLSSMEIAGSEMIPHDPCSCECGDPIGAD